MKVPLSWLRDFVDVPGSAEEIAGTMSVRGFAVEGIDESDGDSAIDFEVTANRPDCMSVMGMAREIATAYGLQVRRPVAVTAVRRAGPADPPDGPALHLTSLKAVEKSDVDVIIENPDLCPRYAGAVADVTVGSSPDWMQARLRAAGVRPISNIVDVTNYVLIEMGHPMHAFDFDKLAGAQIRVRTPSAGETLRTLDGQMRTLTPEMLVIADAARATAIAGVMGGGDSEVSPATKTIVLESAYFNPLSVRRTSKKLGLKTEASMRFERGADPRLPVTAMERAAALIELIGAGRGRGTVVDRYPLRAEPTVLRLRRSRISGLLGASVPDSDVKRILDSLGFALRDDAEGWDVTVPTRRVDVQREVDLIEEVARHYGFDRLPVTFPALETAPPPVDPRITRARQLRGVLAGAGFSEAVTFGFIAEAAAAPFAGADDLVPIANPLSENFAVLRPSALPGLMDAVAHNLRREQRDVRLFEIGARFTRSTGERRSVACVWTGAADGDHWSRGAREVDFFDIKGIAERICQTVRVPTQAEPHRETWLVPGRAAALVARNTRVAVVGQLAPTVTGAHGLAANDAVYVAEVDLDALERLGGQDVRIQPLPRYPSVIRDISILVNDSIAATDIRRTITEAAPLTLVRVREFDRYQGKGISDDKVSLSLRLTFRSSDRTLTDAEVQDAMNGVIGALKERHNAIQR
jgi:phenylalanyl-tRNA synthetase beta chain